MQLAGLFTRVQLKKMSMEDASHELMNITDALDKNAHCYESQKKQMSDETKTLRLRNQKLHQEIYSLKDSIVRLEQKTEKQEKQINMLQEENAALQQQLSSFQQWQDTDESFLLDASIASDPGSKQTTDYELLDASIASDSGSKQTTP